MIERPPTYKERREDGYQVRAHGQWCTWDTGDIHGTPTHHTFMHWHPHEMQAVLIITLALP